MGHFRLRCPRAWLALASDRWTAARSTTWGTRPGGRRRGPALAQVNAQERQLSDLSTWASVAPMPSISQSPAMLLPAMPSTTSLNTRAWSTLPRVLRRPFPATETAPHGLDFAATLVLLDHVRQWRCVPALPSARHPPDSECRWPAPGFPRALHSCVSHAVERRVRWR
jgi:hypothetical protein